MLVLLVTMSLALCSLLCLQADRCSSWTRFCTCPLLCYVWCIGPDSAVLAVPQLQFIKVVVLPVVTQRQIPMILAVQMTISFPQLQLIDNVAGVFVVHVGQVPQVQVVVLTFFPSSWYRSWRRQSRFLLPRDMLDKLLTSC